MNETENQPEENTLQQGINAIADRLDRMEYEKQCEMSPYEKAKLGVMQCLQILLTIAVIYSFILIIAHLAVAFGVTSKSTITDLGLGMCLLQSFGLF